ncbi:MAG: FHA domain-containing protein [Micropruina sp.]|nr:FHA domain-containing protein [Micropruina sp.]
MGKAHKFAWNGIDVETTLTFEQLANLAQRSASECTGDAGRGKQRITSTTTSDRRIEFRISDFLISYKKFLIFHLDVEVRAGRTWLSSRIDWYDTTRRTVAGFIRVGSPSMIAHHTYLQFVHDLARQVRAADPQARVTIREGAEGAAGPAAPASDPPGERRSPVSFSPGAQPEPVEVMPSVALGPVVSAAPDDSPLVTSVPGMPQRETRSAPVAELSLADELLGNELLGDDALLHTRFAGDTPSAPGWMVRFPDGAQQPLAPVTVWGRNPTAPPATNAVPVAVEDPYRSMSKTHALLELRDGVPQVTDLHSTNGTTVTDDRGALRGCEPGSPVSLGDGWVVGLGSYRITVLTTTAPQ